MLAKQVKRWFLHLDPIQSLTRARSSWQRRHFSSSRYWEDRYRAGGSSGAGSYGTKAEEKAAYLNGFVSSRGVSSVIEFGCGDGNQLRYAIYPRYLGFDVSESAVAGCVELFADDDTKAFHLLDEYEGEVADLVLSLDVVYHLIEDKVFEEHMRLLFSASRRFVIVFSTNQDFPGIATHVRHREFTRWTDQHATAWRLIDEPSDTDRARRGDWGEPTAGFYVYESLDWSSG